MKVVRSLAWVVALALAGPAVAQTYPATPVRVIGIVAHAGTPKQIVDRWHREVVRIVALPDVRDRLAMLGFNAVANSPAQFAARRTRISG